jgi:hypothetical protein
VDIGLIIAFVASVKELQQRLYMHKAAPCPAAFPGQRIDVTTCRVCKNAGVANIPVHHTPWCPLGKMEGVKRQLKVAHPEFFVDKAKVPTPIDKLLTEPIAEFKEGEFEQ